MIRRKVTDLRPVEKVTDLRPIKKVTDLRPLETVTDLRPLEKVYSHRLATPRKSRRLSGNATKYPEKSMIFGVGGTFLVMGHPPLTFVPQARAYYGRFPGYDLLLRTHYGTFSGEFR